MRNSQTMLITLKLSLEMIDLKFFFQYLFCVEHIHLKPVFNLRFCTQIWKCKFGKLYILYENTVIKSFVMCNILVILSHFYYKINACTLGNLEKHKEENKVPF